VGNKKKNRLLMGRGKKSHKTGPAKKRKGRCTIGFRKVEINEEEKGKVLQWPVSQKRDYGNNDRRNG